MTNVRENFRSAGMVRSKATGSASVRSLQLDCPLVGSCWSAMALSGEDFGWRVRVQRLQIVRQQAEAFCQRRREFHEIQLPIDQDRLKVSIIENMGVATSGELLFDLAIDRFGQPFAIARHGRLDPSKPECRQTDGVTWPKRKVLDASDPSAIEDDDHATTEAMNCSEGP
ncbi:hypothetical protein [Bosea sp. FBZP-16]|uniref:hypothetical protein n=1 Tax=Bosea sp. FBZP-16 TaxID=2065382 RepID=UPI001319FF7F|nr:hypothetical protein [Bosea sp. FBZP-16]